MHYILLSTVCILCLCPEHLSFKSVLIGGGSAKNVLGGSAKNVLGSLALKPIRGRFALSATEKETLSELRDKMDDSDYPSAFQILKRNPLTQLGIEDARELLNNLDSLVTPTGDIEKYGQEMVDSCTFLYKRFERQNVLKGFGCVDGEYPEKSVDITPAKLEQITGMSMASLIPAQRGNNWRLSGLAFCVAEYFIGKQLGIDPLTTLIPLTFGVFAVDQIFYQGAAFETAYQKLFPQYRKKIIDHEAGHFLLAYLLGIPVRGCITNAWDARKYPEIRGQAGTIFFDQKLANELQNQKMTRSSLDRMSVVIMAGIAAEAILYGKAEGGAADERNLVAFLTSIQPPWDVLRIQGQARWAAMQAILLIKEHQASYTALCNAIDAGKSVGDCVIAIEDNLPVTLPSAQRIEDRIERKKTMESDQLMRYIQKVTYKVGGIEHTDYATDTPTPSESTGELPNIANYGPEFSAKLREGLEQVWENNQKKLIQDKLKGGGDEVAKPTGGMDGFITQQNPMKKMRDGDSERFADEIDDDEANMEKDETVRLFKQKIRQLEKAVKQGQLDINDKQDETGGVWVNNLDTLGSRRGKSISPTDSGDEGMEGGEGMQGKGGMEGGGGMGGGGKDGKEKKESKRLTTSAMPLGGRGKGPEIIMPPLLSGYKEPVYDELSPESEAFLESDANPWRLSEDNVLRQITSAVDISPPREEREEKDGKYEKDGKTEKDVTSGAVKGSQIEESPTRGMLNHQRGYQMKKIENMQAGYRKKVSDIDARMEELREAIAKRELTSTTKK